MRKAAISLPFFPYSQNLAQRPLSLLGALSIAGVTVIKSIGDLERAVNRVCVHLGVNVVR